MRLDLHNHDGTPAGHLDWNPKTWELTGPLADEVLELVAAAVADGGIHGHPEPSFYRVTDPLRHAGQLGLVLEQRWLVPEPLQDAVKVLVDRKSRATVPAPPGACY